MTKELDLHLLELARTEGEVPRRDLIAETLAHLRDAEWDAHPRTVDYVLEVDEDPLGRLRPQEGRVFLAAQRSDNRLEHQIELAWRRQGAEFLGVRPEDLAEIPDRRERDERS